MNKNLNENENIRLVECSSCGKKISRRAKNCPHCEHIVDKHSQSKNNDWTKKEANSHEHARMLVLEGMNKKSAIVSESTVQIIDKKRNNKKVLPILHIASVQIKRPGILTGGFIKFVGPGDKPLKSSFKVTGGAWAAIVDDNSIMFVKEEQYQIALQIEEYIQNFNQSGVMAQGANKAPNSVADEIIKLKKLMDEGIITKDEFEAKKKQLLDI